MEDISAAFQPIIYSLAQLIVVIASSRYLAREKNYISKLLFYGSLFVLISYIMNSLSFYMIKFVDFDSFPYELIFGGINLVSIVGVVCFAIGFYNLIKKSLNNRVNELNNIEE